MTKRRKQTNKEVAGSTCATNVKKQKKFRHKACMNGTQIGFIVGVVVVVSGSRK